MSKSIKPEDLGGALAEQLGLYHKSVIEGVNAAGENAVKDLVKKTKATAPVASGSFKKNIAWKAVDKGLGHKTFVWHVKAPDHRLTHLLVHGHATRNGGRTKSNPFLKNALDDVLPAYEREVQEAVKNG